MGPVVVLPVLVGQGVVILQEKGKRTHPLSRIVLMHLPQNLRQSLLGL